jgi:hypothetical protein
VSVPCFPQLTDPEVERVESALDQLQHAGLADGS